MNVGKCRYVTALLLVVFCVLTVGCESKALMLERYFGQIKVGQSSTTDVLNMLPEEGMMHTTNSVSVLREVGPSREVGIVVFGQEDSLVHRTDYLQRRSALPFERLGLVVQTVVSVVPGIGHQLAHLADNIDPYDDD